MVMQYFSKAKKIAMMCYKMSSWQILNNTNMIIQKHVKEHMICYTIILHS